MPNADHAMITGRAHHVCQDFVASGQTAGGPFAIVADGCSTSPDTDTGARLVVHQARLTLTDNVLPDADPADGNPDLHRFVAWRALAMARDLKLSERSCDATLLMIRAQGASFKITVCGDGAVALKPKRSPGFLLYVISYDAETNRPGYVSYLAQPDYAAAFSAATDNVKTVTFYAPGAGEPARPVCAGSAASNNYLEVYGGLIADFEWAAVTTDGLSSFYRSDELGRPVPIPVEAVAARLFDFKGRGGQFAQRRLNRFVKDAAKDGWINSDDLGIAVVNFG